MALSPCIVVTNDICVLITGAGLSIYEFVRTELLIPVTLSDAAEQRFALRRLILAVFFRDSTHGSDK